MTGRCYFLRKRFLPCLEGGLPSGSRERLEKHLARCRECRALFEMVQAGHEAGRELGRTDRYLRQRPPVFEELRSRAGELPVQRGLRLGTWRRLLDHLTAPVAVQILIVFALALTVLFLLSHRNMPRGAEDRPMFSASATGGRNFRALSIAAFEPNAHTPVVTEGLVRHVYFDDEENTLHIKLVEPGESAGPFVICEVHSLSGMAIPREGNHVRVYGMARFDPEPGRGWNEVNPVTNIDILKR
jgi:Putative zinc-finger